MSLVLKLMLLGLGMHRRFGRNTVLDGACGGL